jgi:hypothetical protein
VVSSTPRPQFTPGKDPVPIVQEAGWAPGPVWTGVENLAPTGIRSPDRPARSQSLYQLSQPGPLKPDITFALLVSDEAHFHLAGCESYQKFFSTMGPKQSSRGSSRLPRISKVTDTFLWN